MDLFENYLNSAYRFLANRPRSEKEVRDNLRKKSSRKKYKGSQLDPQTLEKIIAYLKEKKFLGDEAFVQWWIDQRTKFRPKSMRVIKLELRQKGISREIIENSITNDELLMTNEKEMIKKLIDKRLPRLKNLPDKEVRNKLWQFLARRGFDSDDIKESIDEKLRVGV